jgi:flagellar biosynthesis protein FliR
MKLALKYQVKEMIFNIRRLSFSIKIQYKTLGKVVVTISFLVFLHYNHHYSFIKILILSYNLYIPLY